MSPDKRVKREVSTTKSTPRRKTKTSSVGKKVVSEEKRSFDVKRIPIKKLISHPENPNVHSETNIQAIMKSLSEFGQQSNIVVNNQMYILKGNGTVEAARRLGWRSLWVRVEDSLTGEQELQYLIADNQTSNTSKFDRDSLSNLFGKIKDPEPTGFSTSSVVKLIDPNDIKQRREKKENELTVRFQGRDQMDVIRSAISIHDENNDDTLSDADKICNMLRDVVRQHSVYGI